MLTDPLNPAHQHSSHRRPHSQTGKPLTRQPPLRRGALVVECFMIALGMESELRMGIRYRRPPEPCGRAVDVTMAAGRGCIRAQAARLQG